MTTSRVIRGPRVKIFLYVSAILIITGIIACYNNTLSQLEDARLSNEICQHQQENLSAQLHVISDYKIRLEKSLKTERAEHQQTKASLETKLNEEKSQNEKASSDAKNKFDSLRQNWNLLEIQHNDLKEEFDKMSKKHRDDVNEAELKLKDMKEEIMKLKSDKEHIKSNYLELQDEKKNIDKQLNDIQGNKNDNKSQINHLTKENNELRRELNAFKEKCSSYDTLLEPKQNMDVSSQKNVMSEVSPSLLQILNSSNKSQDANVLNIPPGAEKQEKGVLDLPNSNNLPSSTKSTTKSGLKASQGSLNGARPLLIPTVTPETSAKKKVVVSVNQNSKEDLPEGVVAKPEKKEETNENDQQEVIDNRYNNAQESAIHEGAAKEDVDKDNGAHEVYDGAVLQNEGLAFGDNEQIKHPEKPNLDTNNFGKNNYNQDPPDDNNGQNDPQLEAGNDEDDDGDDYDDQGPKDPIVRN